MKNNGSANPTYLATPRHSLFKPACYVNFQTSGDFASTVHRPIANQKHEPSANRIGPCEWKKDGSQLLFSTIPSVQRRQGIFSRIVSFELFEGTDLFLQCSLVKN
ncbi:MAG: hypothetical protein ABFC77_15805 [Thermoguttaceae bacterium]